MSTPYLRAIGQIEAGPKALAATKNARFGELSIEFAEPTFGPGASFTFLSPGPGQPDDIDIKITIGAER